MRMLLPQRANNKKRCPGVKLLQNIEHFVRVLGRRAIIDRDPDFALGCLKSGRDRSPPLAIWNQGGVEQKQMRNKDRREREGDVRPDEENRDQRRERGKAEEQGAHYLRVIWLMDERHREGQGGAQQED